MFVNWNVGSNLTFSKRICETIKEGIDRGMYTIQFCMGNMRTYNRSIISKDDIAECKVLLDRFPTSIFTHFPYIANLCGCVKELAWCGNDDTKILNVIKSIEYELSIIASLGIDKSGVVIHPGSFKDRDKGINTIVKTLNKINYPVGSKLLLEICAGEGNEIPMTIEELYKIYEGVDESKKDNIGICIDTCHIFASGQYDLSKKSEVDRMFGDFKKFFKIEKFCLLHLNDSKREHGSRVDRHELLGQGHIWNKSFDSLVHLLDKCKEYGIPMVLETHATDMYTLMNLQK